MTGPGSASGAGQWRVAPLLRHVVDGGYCIGCGACAAVAGSPLTMRLQPDGLYRPEPDPAHRDPGADPGTDLGAVCPFYAGTDEDDLAAERYADSPYDPRIGFFRALHAGAVGDTAQRAHSSSGGIVTWVLLRLLARGDIDGVIHVGATPAAEDSATEDSATEDSATEDSAADADAADADAADADADADAGVLFRYRLSTAAEQIRAGAKSRYYPVEFSRVAAFVRDRPGRYAFVGVPCFVKALRLLARQDGAIDRAVVCCIALFCGHMKSDAYARHLGWQIGIPPANLQGIDFRAKRPDSPANRYGIIAIGRSEAGQPVERRAPVHRLHGTDWGLGLFKPGACDFCDDIAGETADLAAGDAWLPEYVHDPRGTSVLVVRSRHLQRLLEEGKRSADLALDPLAPDRLVASQAASYRHRRDGLAARLHACDYAGLWRPRKRVEARRDHLDRRQHRVVELRRALAARSHTAFVAARIAGRHALFRRRMAPLILRYYGANRGYLRSALRWALLRLPAGLRRRLPGVRRL